jgi:hypothetical protein
MRDEEGQNMEMTEEIVLTPEGYELKKKKLEEYRRILYEELPKKLKLAKEHGAELRGEQRVFRYQARARLLRGRGAPPRRAA